MEAADETTLDTEVLVIGGGISGYSAALAAAEAGSEVLLVEKTGAAGGSAVLSGGSFAFADTDMQRDEGIDDSAERLRDDILRSGLERNDRELVDLYVANQLDAYTWMKSIGIEFLTVSLSGGQTVPRSHSPNVHDMFEVLERRASEQEMLRVLKNAPAVRLLTDSGTPGGCSPDVARVCGALVGVDGHQHKVVARSGTILATGGFTRNKSLLGVFAPKAELATPISAESHDGDGLRFGMSVGAGLADMGTIAPTFGMATGTGRPIFLHAIYRGGIVVDPKGRRFVDESRSYKQLARVCLELDVPLSFQIFDARIMAQSIPGKMNNDFAAGLEAGYVRTAETIEGLANVIDIDPSTLSATVADYNDGARQGIDPEFGRSSLGGGAGALVTLDEAPYFAIPSLIAQAGTLGGITVDTSMRVRNVYGDVVPQLFAAGEVVGGFHGGGYVSGTSLGKSVIFGRIAGRAAART